MATSHFIVLRDDLNPAEMSDIENRMEEVKGVTSVVSYHKMLGTGIPDFFIPNEVKDMLKQGGYQLMMVNSSYFSGHRRSVGPAGRDDRHFEAV